MLKRGLIALLAVVVLGGAGVYFWARSVLTQDNVRAAVAAQFSDALGQPVTIGGIGATLTPRLSLELRDVHIGQPARIRLMRVQVGTDLRALLSRRVEHATARVDGADIELPLPMFGPPPATATSPPAPGAPADAGAPAAPSGGASALPLAIVSIDEIVVSDIKLTSSGRILRGSLELVPESGGAVTIRTLSLKAEDVTIEATGRITDIAGPVGELTIDAGDLNIDALFAFFQEFTAGATAATAAAMPAPAPDVVRVAVVEEAQELPSATAASRVNLTVNLKAARGTTSGLTLDALSGRAVVRDQGIIIDPVAFGIFGGRYEGRAAVGTPPSGDMAFGFTATLTGVDMRAVNAFTHSTDTLTGTLGGTLDLTGTGADVKTALRRAHGTLRVDITNGVVRNLGVVRAVVLATSGRGTGGDPATAVSAGAASAAGASRDEPFTRLGATLAIASLVATTRDLRFESPSVSMSLAGTLRLDGSAIDMKGEVQLSDELSKQAGRDLVRLTQVGGRVTLPATITGLATDPTVRIDIGGLASRALQNAAKEELDKAIKKGLDDLFGRKKK